MFLGHRAYLLVRRRPLHLSPRFQRPLVMVGPYLEALQVAALLRRLLRRSLALGDALQVRQNLAGRPLHCTTKLACPALLAVTLCLCLYSMRCV